MFMGEYPADEIIHLHQRIWHVLALLSPILIHLHQDDIEGEVNRLVRFRGQESVERDIQMTSRYPWFKSRGLNSLEGWVQFFTAWQAVAAQLYADWPFRKIKISHPHDDWKLTYQQMIHFLQFK
jgi:hypothetical protein